jgi:glycosyltransferase involved in cell wall biosynthesis
VGECVRLAGPQPQEEVRRLLSESTLFVLACEPEPDGGMDTLPTVIAEAMAAGLPVVSTRLAGIPEMVTHGETGLLVGARDPEALAEALETLLRDPAQAGRMGARGKAAAAERFAVQTTVAQLRALLK